MVCSIIYWILLFYLGGSCAATVPRVRGHDLACAPLFQSLLDNVGKLLESEPLCKGIPLDKVAPRSQTETIQACAPTVTKDSGCLLPIDSSFSESKCLDNIAKDLVYYEAVIKSYCNATERHPHQEDGCLQPLIGIIQNLRNKCSLKPNEENDSSEETPAQMWDDNSFSNRLKMCKLMRGFKLRAITMNRAFRYMSSGQQQA